MTMTTTHVPSLATAAERMFARRPEACRNVDVLLVGGGLGLEAGGQLQDEARAAGVPLSVAVLDAGPLDLLTHLGNTRWPRQPFLAQGTERVGGKLALWGVSTPRPPRPILERWGYDMALLERRFQEVEAELGVADPKPLAGRALEARVRERLAGAFPAAELTVAPLAIDRDGHRWSPLDRLPERVRAGLLVVPRFRCQELVREGDSVVAVRGEGEDGQVHTIRARFVVLAVGIEGTLPLLRQVIAAPPLAPSDHIRIDLHGTLPAGYFGAEPVDALGICTLIHAGASVPEGVPYHVEIKVAPRGLWARGCVVSADNLRGADDDRTIYVQLQVVAAMHDRLPTSDLLNVGQALHPVMSARDAELHGELVRTLRALARAVGLERPTFCLRPLLTNHHGYGLLRVGQAVDRSFRVLGTENLYVLPPTAFPDADDDANPTLKSLVLTRFAVADIVARAGRLTTPVAA